MDGVLANFDRGVKELCGLEPSNQSSNTPTNDDRMWEAIKNVEHFYDRLEPMNGAIEMYKELSTKYDVEILTGIPKAKRGILTAGDDKIAWAHRLLSEDLVVNIVYREEKKTYAVGPEYILIDDLKMNIDEWIAAGGTGIIFTSAQDVIEKINALR